MHIFHAQVCIGAVQRPVLADVYTRYTGSPVLPACPFGRADPDVQRHPEHALAPCTDSKACLFIFPPCLFLTTREHQSSSVVLSGCRVTTEQLDLDGQGELCRTTVKARFSVYC